MIKKLFSQLIPWIINNLLKVLRLKNRDQNLWIFGAWGGDNYSDNAKYLFDYVNKKLPKIHAIWITKNIDIKRKVIEDGNECLLFNESEGRKARLNAGYVFFTNGIIDFGPYDLCQGAVKIALWHGMPLKKLWYATNNLEKRKNNIFRFIQYSILKIYNHAQRDFTIATSETTKKLLIECFEVKPETVFITGQPRNEILFNASAAERMKQILNHQSDEKFVLYMPTWREKGLNDAFLDSIITELYSDNFFLKELESKRIKLYIKPHPRISLKSKSSGNVIILESMSNIDSQELIASADMIITDYSSVFMDFALLERPLHFFIPDIEEYKKDRLGLFFNISEFSEFWFRDIETFKGVILEQNNFDDYGIKNSDKVNQLFNDPKLIKGQYSKEVIKALKIKSA